MGYWLVTGPYFNHYQPTLERALDVAKVALAIGWKNVRIIWCSDPTKAERAGCHWGAR